MGDGSSVALVVAGSLAVRLDAGARAFERQVARELGGAPGDPAGLPELVVRVAPRLGDPASLTRLGLTGGEFAYDAGDFYVADRDHRLTMLDLEGTGPRIELVAERGVTRIPHLAALASLLVLERGRVLLHAASLTVDGGGILVPGWQSGGKSELLLGWMATGRARYGGDEWTVVDGEGRMHAVPSAVQLWAWQMRQLPELRRRVPASEHRRLAVIALGRGALRRLPAGPADRLAGRLLVSLAGALANADRVSVDPRRLFGDALDLRPARVDRVVLPSVSGDGRTEVAPVDGTEVAERMAASLVYERRGLDAAYAQYRYAFPGRTWPRLEAAPAAERALLSAALGPVPAVAVRHAYPPDLAALAAATDAALP